MPELYPTFELPAFQTATDSRQADRYSADFDFEQGDFVRSKAGAVGVAEPYAVWVQWCIKAVSTKRYACFAYGDNEGAETEEALSEPGRLAQESALQRTITETLLADPYRRTVYVRDFEFEWDGDSVVVAFTVGGVWEKEERLKAAF